jgi:hypothetical protein
VRDIQYSLVQNSLSDEAGGGEPELFVWMQLAVDA